MLRPAIPVLNTSDRFGRTRRSSGGSVAPGLAFFEPPLGYIYSASGLFGWLIIVAVLAGIASLVPARNATRVTVREALACE